MNATSNKPAKRLPRPGSKFGQILAIVAVLLMGMLAILGLVVDSGLVYSARRQARRAADAAAQAGAITFISGTNAAQCAIATAIAFQYAGTNGANTNGYVLVQTPPEASSNSIFAGSNGYIFVQVTIPVNTTFLRLLSTQRTVNVTASATAGTKPTPCPLTILALSPTGDAFKVNGSASLSIPGGTIAVNSSAANAVRVLGGASLTCSNLTVVGNVSGPVTGTVTTGALSVTDPFASVVAPVITGANQVTYGDGTTGSTSANSGGTAASPAKKTIAGGTVTLNQGIYWGGISISGGATVTLNAGRYVMAGGGFSVSGGSSVTGTNIFIYNTRDPYRTTGPGAYGSIDFTGGSTCSLKARTTSLDPTYGGFLFFNDRASNEDIKIAGGSGSAATAPLSGYIYGINSQMKVTGGGHMGGIGAIVKSVDVSGSAQFATVDTTRTPSSTSVSLME